MIGKMLLLKTCISLLAITFLETPLMAETSCEGRVVGYLRSWSSDNMSRQKMASLTHVIFAFFHLAENGTLSVGDGFDNFEGNSGRKLKRLFDSNSNTTTPKILFAIGGWGNSKFLSKLSATDGSRKALASEILRIIHKYNFDGVDIDWEYPVSGGHHKGHPDDKVNFVKLLEEIRKQFDEQKLLLTPRKVLSVATSAGSSQIEVSFNMEEIMKIVDFVNIMTYDYYGEWNQLTGPCAPLYMNENGMSRTPVSMTVDSNIKEHYCKYNDLAKFNLGVAFYGRYWNNVEGQNPGLFSIARKNQKGKVDGGSISYKDIRQSREWDLSKAKFDDETRTPFIYQNGKLLTYENEVSIREKVEYSRVKGLGGVMIWAVDQDDNDNSLLEAVKAVRCGHPQQSPPFNCDSNLRMNDNEDQVSTPLLTTIKPRSRKLFTDPPMSDDDKWYPYNHRHFGLCGLSAPKLPNGRVPICNPDDIPNSCCSEFGFCGSTAQHCECPNCIDFYENADYVYLSPERCGTSQKKKPNGEYPVCNGYDIFRHCCSEFGYCGSTALHCKCVGCVDFSKKPDFKYKTN